MRENDLLKTPKYITDALGGFDLDPCSSSDPKDFFAANNYNPSFGEDGLIKEWNGFVFCNPPFSEKEKWIKKMINHNNGILLLPERGSAPWFGPLAKKCGKYFVMGKKINFIGGLSSNNIGTCLFPFGEKAVFRIMYSKLPGHFVNVLYYRSREQC